jgi:hypothetical protein
VDRVGIALALEGSGTVWVDDLQLLDSDYPAKRD